MPRTSTAATTTAVLLATAAAEEGGPAAALPLEGSTILDRLLGQLQGLGVREAVVITRPGWREALEASPIAGTLATRVVESPALADDLRTIATVARGADGPVLVAYADMVSHREALAGLLAHPRVATGILVRAFRPGASLAFGTRSRRGWVVAAVSPYHSVWRSNGTFLGALKADPRDRDALVDAAERLAALTSGGIPAEWGEELRRKRERWRDRLAELRRQRDGGALSPQEEEAFLERRLGAAGEDAAALLLVALVRSGVRVGNAALRRFFWARPLAGSEAELAARELRGYDEERLALDVAVKANDGLFTTLFVSPYSKYVARWAARVGISPNAVTTASMAVGALAAGAFAIGSRPALVAGALLLQAAFTLDCVDGQLARYTRNFSSFGAWLDAVFDRGKEYLVYAGLAVGASAGFGDHVWGLAAAALALQVVRHMLGFAYRAGQPRPTAAVRLPPLEQPSEDQVPPAPPAAAAGRATAAASPPPSEEAAPRRDSGAPPASPARAALGRWQELDEREWTRWVRKVIALPIGERFAAISLTAALFTPRTTFVVLLAWGGFAAVYSAAGRVLRAMALSREQAAAGPGSPAALALYRDDGPVAAGLGRVLRRPGRAADRLGWLAPPAIRAVEYGALIALAVAAGERSVVACFALLSVLAFRHYEAVYRMRFQAEPPPRWVQAIGGGWEVRLLLAAVLAVTGLVFEGYLAMAVLLAVPSVAESVVSWVRFSRSGLWVPDADADDDELDEDDGV